MAGLKKTDLPNSLEKITDNKDNVKIRTAREITDDEIAEALQKTNGLQTSAAKWLLKYKNAKIDRSTISKRIKNSKELQDVADEIDSKTLDFAEGALLEHIQNKNLKAIIFYLKCKGKERGYVERQEISAEVSAEVKKTNPFEGMTLDEIKALAHAKPAD